MKARWAKFVLTGAMVALLASCSSKPTDRGQQYKDGKFSQPFSLVNQPDAVGAPINAGDFSEQVSQIRGSAPRLYGNQSSVYNAIEAWLRAGGDTRSLRQFGIDAWQMEGTDNYGNVQFTGYYTPVVQRELCAGLQQLADGQLHYGCAGQRLYRFRRRQPAQLL